MNLIKHTKCEEEIPNPRKWLNISFACYFAYQFYLTFARRLMVLLIYIYIFFHREFYATPIFCNYFVVCLCVWFTTCITIKYSVYSEFLSPFFEKERERKKTQFSNSRQHFYFPFVFAFNFPKKKFVLLKVREESKRVRAWASERWCAWVEAALSSLQLWFPRFFTFQS